MATDAKPPAKKKAAGRKRVRLGPDARRKQLLSAAQSLFRERHYAAVSLDDIAAEAGVARGLINHYFGNKRDLYIEVVREMVRFPPMPIPEYVRGKPLRQRVSEAIDSWLGSVENNREMWLESTRSQGLGDPEVGAMVEEAREEAARRMIEILGLGPVAEVGPERLAMMRAYGGLAEAAILQWLERERFTRDQVLELLVESATRMSDHPTDPIVIADPARLGAHGTGAS